MPTDPRLAPFVEQLGDPAAFFVDDAWRDYPLVVEHATGRPRYAIVGAALVPWERHRPPSPPARPEAARPPVAGPPPLALATGQPGFAGTMEVLNG